MTWIRTLWAAALMVAIVSPLAAQQSDPAADPVLQARAQRAAAKGVSEDDLPPVPRSIVEPPPLPPPELHPRDQKGSRAARAARKGGRATQAKVSKKGRSSQARQAKRGPKGSAKRSR